VTLMAALQAIASIRANAEAEKQEGSG
jgi:hypothetical protein